MNLYFSFFISQLWKTFYLLVFAVMCTLFMCTGQFTNHSPLQRSLNYLIDSLFIFIYHLVNMITLGHVLGCNSLHIFWSITKLLCASTHIVTSGHSITLKYDSSYSVKVYYKGKKNMGWSYIDRWDMGSTDRKLLLVTILNYFTAMSSKSVIVTKYSVIWKKE